MAVSYVTQKCSSCASTKLEFVPELKAWKCAYCGTMIERHEQQDNLFTIKNVVRQTLIDIAYQRMSSAQSNIIECEKIDSKYVGTIIAQIAYNMNMIIGDSVSQTEQRNMFAQIKKNFVTLNEKGSSPSEEEIALYDSLDSSEAIGVLILVFDVLNSVDRCNFLYNYFKPMEVYSTHLNEKLIAFFLQNQKFELFDEVVHNTDNIDRVKTIKLILDNYPDCKEKAKNLFEIINSEDNYTEEDAKMFAHYLSSSADNVETLSCVTKSLYRKKVFLPTDLVFEKVISKMSDTSAIAELVDLMMSKRLVDVEIYTVLDYAFQRCKDEVCIYVLEKMHSTNQFVELNHNNLYKLLERKSPVAVKIKLIELCLNFNINKKAIELFISHYLNSVEEPNDIREEMLTYLFGLVDDFSVNTVEQYVVKCQIDKDNKVQIVKKIFEKNLNKTLYRNLLGVYVNRSNDPPEIKKEIIYILVSEGLGSSAVALDVITKPGLSDEEGVMLLRRLSSGGTNYNEIVNPYLMNVDKNSYNPAIWCELLSNATRINESVFVKYVLQIPDSASIKSNCIRKMVNHTYGINNIMCTVNHNGNTINCNIVQGYILSSLDSIETSVLIADMLSREIGQLDSEINVSGSRMKFKKYISSQKRVLDEKTRKICETCRVL